jgi:hypothetical protein
MNMQQPSFVRVIAFAVALATAACGSSPTKPSTNAATSADGGDGLPESVEGAKALRASGSSWTDVQIREHYLRLVARIGPANDQWKKDGVKAEERARRAYKMRYEARMTCRTMMSDPTEVEELRARDQRRFGHPDGPTFDELVEHEKSKGATGDAIYDAIVVSAQRTDPVINELLSPAKE